MSKADPIKHGLSAWWQENSERERANPPSDKPTYAEMVEYGEDFSTAPADRPIWVIEQGSTGTFIGRWHMGHFFIEEAGDLWPSKPSRWISRERAAEIVAARATPSQTGEQAHG